ncbi:hypothetical protein QP028_14475 [Corynebacterium suedekumii]|nr:hypothetical protein QP028_14475 [Corynebacterium suedekumii]
MTPFDFDVVTGEEVIDLEVDFEGNVVEDDRETDGEDVENAQASTVSATDAVNEALRAAPRGRARRAGARGRGRQPGLEASSWTTLTATTWPSWTSPPTNRLLRPASPAPAGAGLLHVRAPGNPHEDRLLHISSSFHLRFVG